MASIINSTDTGSGGLITTGDSSDELQLQTAETTAVTITSGQQSAFIAGTAAAPAVTTTGDLNTGVFFPAADNIGFTTGGTIRGRWTTDGLCFGTDTAAANALDDYEEGTWTPADVSGAGLTLNVAGTARYVKIGRFVFFNVDNVTYPSTVDGNAASVGGLPFTVDSNNHGTLSFVATTTNASAGLTVASTTKILFYANGSTNASTNANLSTQQIFGISGCYQVA